MMTRKDYVLVAKALKAQKEQIITTSSVQTRIIDETIETLAAHFALVNDNFKKETFMEAAGHGTDSDA
jgi:hypothetical protein